MGRPYELGRKIGAASRELSALREEKAVARLHDDFHLDDHAARNLLTFLREQQDATGAVPSDRTIVVERFRDEIGDWRVCILTPFGGRVHAPWAMAIAARLREAHGIEAQRLAKTGRGGKRPRRVHAGAERREDADAPVADLVPKTLDDHGPVGRHRRRRPFLLA